MDAVQRMINRLQAGSEFFACSSYLSGLDSLHQTDIYTTLVFQRLQRKHDALTKLYNELGQNWNQTFYTLLLRYLGAPANSEPFEELSKRTGYAAVLRHSDSVKKLEALFIGTSGLLDLCNEDDYIIELRREFDHLAALHNLKKMSPDDWHTRNIYPLNHPILRMAQVAAFFSQQYFRIEKLLDCASPKDVENLLCCDASDYWVDHFVPAMPSKPVTKRIGSTKSDILAINVVVPLQYAYGCYIDKYELHERAQTLLDAIKAENNFKVRRWTDGGLIVRSALDTQALIQLGDEYCLKQRCTECPVGRRIINSFKRSCNIE